MNALVSQLDKCLRLCGMSEQESGRSRELDEVRLGDVEDLAQLLDADGRLGQPDLCARSGSASADPDRANIPKGGRFAAAVALIMSA